MAKRTSDKLHHRPEFSDSAYYTPEEYKLHALWLLTDSVFKQKNLDIANAHEFTKYMGWHYNLLQQEGKIGESNEFLAMYETIIHAMQSLEDREILDKIAGIINNFMSNIDKIFEDSRDTVRFQKGIDIMFKVLFRCFTSTQMADALSEGIKDQLATALEALNEQQEKAVEQQPEEFIEETVS